MSDEIDWYIVLNDGFYPSTDDDEEIEEEYAWYDLLPEARREKVKLESWERSFDVFRKIAPCQFIQATFWELRLEQVIEVRNFKGRYREKLHKREDSGYHDAS